MYFYKSYILNVLTLLALHLLVLNFLFFSDYKICGGKKILIGFFSLLSHNTKMHVLDFSPSPSPVIC